MTIEIQENVGNFSFLVNFKFLLFLVFLFFHFLKHFQFYLFFSNHFFHFSFLRFLSFLALSFSLCFLPKHIFNFGIYFLPLLFLPSFQKIKLSIIRSFLVLPCIHFQAFKSRYWNFNCHRKIQIKHFFLRFKQEK